MAITTHLRALQALELAIRTGSMKAAAARLAITPAALGQRIKGLEDYLGVDLLVRGRSGIRPTAELDAALAHLSAAFRELDTVTRILDFQRVDEIHITADTDWAELWLRPRLAAYQQANPNTLFCINGVGDVPVRLGEADCEIYFGAARETGADQLLFHDYLLPIASPENARRIAAAAAGPMLEGFPLLHLDCYTADAGAIGWPEWISRHGHRATAPGRGIRYKRVVHALEAVYANAGLMVCGLALVAAQIKSATLSRPFPIAAGAWSRHAYRAAFPPESLRRAQVAAFKDWLLAAAQATVAELRDATNSEPPALQRR